MSELMHQISYRGTAHIAEMPALDVQNLSASYGNGGNRGSSTDLPPTLQDITFQVQMGEQIGVVGPNGAGKSTLFKLIAGILQPDAGRIKISGHPPDKHICIAYLPQRNEIDFSFPVTVEDVVMMGRAQQIGLFHRPRSHDHEKVQASLARVHATHLAKKQIGQLSSGQQQRVFIARALAQETNLLLFDEPLTGLDLPSREAIFDILASLRPDGVTVLVATHDLNLAAERFDRVMLLNRQIVAMGQAKTVLTTTNLLRAYGGQMHVLNTGNVVLADNHNP